MTRGLQNFLIAETAYTCVYNILFLYLFIRKVHKLDRLSVNLEISITHTTWVKFSIILAIMLLFMLHVVLAFCDSHYWLSQYPNYSLLTLLFIVNYTLQLYIVAREVRKCQRRHLASTIYWIIIFITELIEIVVVEKMLPTPSATTVLQLLVCVLNIGLVMITVLFQKGGRDSDMLEILLHPSTGRSIQTSVIRSDRFPISNHLYIEFNREFQVIQQKQAVRCDFKIAVYLEETVNIITKSDSQFEHLGNEMAKLFPNNQQVQLTSPPKYFQNMMKYGEEKQRFFETYLLEVTKTDQFYCPPLLEFLEISSSARTRLVSRQRHVLKKKESLFSEDEEHYRMPFFRVQSQKNNIIIISNPDILQLIINKKNSQILEFHNRLVEQKRLNMELLPEQPQQADIVHFFGIVVNRKNLWRSFAQWFGLGAQLEEKIHCYFDVWNSGFRSVEMAVIGHQRSFDKEGRLHTLYLLSIQRRPLKETVSHDLGKTEGLILKKRYSDFFSLNKEVIKFISKNKLKVDHLQEMPPKISTFGSKTSPKSRVTRFDQYIKELIRIEGINRCIKLLQFLQVDAVSQPPSFYEQDESLNANLFEHSERSYFSELNERTY